MSSRKRTDDPGLGGHHVDRQASRNGRQDHGGGSRNGQFR